MLNFAGKQVESVSFLVTVNDTWWPGVGPGGDTCIKTVKTPPIPPNQPWNESKSIDVGKCDHGPLTYTLTNISEKYITLVLAIKRSMLRDHKPFPVLSIYQVKVNLLTCSIKL